MVFPIVQCNQLLRCHGRVYGCVRLVKYAYAVAFLLTFFSFHDTSYLFLFGEHCNGTKGVTVCLLLFLMTSKRSWPPIRNSIEHFRGHLLQLHVYKVTYSRMYPRCAVLPGELTRINEKQPNFSVKILLCEERSHESFHFLFLFQFQISFSSSHNDATGTGDNVCTH